MDKPVAIVIDTNVLVSALQSSRGASYALLRELETERIRAVISVPLFLEYEEVLGRFVTARRIPARSKGLILDYLCAHALPVEVHFLWRPSLRDPGDEMVLEAAIAAGSPWIVTHNIKDFSGLAPLGIEAATPRDFLMTLEQLP